jgi:hypothetical protein
VTNHQVAEGITVKDLLVEALLAVAKAVESTWTESYGGLYSLDSVTVLLARLGLDRSGPIPSSWPGGTSRSNGLRLVGP